MLHKYPHFNPNKHQVDVKIAVVRTGFHCKHNINYHLVWIPKYRRTVLQGVVSVALRNVLTCQCKNMGLELLALEIMPDHLHLFISAYPIIAIHKLVKAFKGRSSNLLRKEFPELLKIPSLWTHSYFVSTAGNVSNKTIQKYIEQQSKI